MTQRPVEQSYALGVGTHEQRVLDIGGVTGGRRRFHHAAASTDGTESRLPQGLPAPAAEGAEETGGEEWRAQEGFGKPEPTVFTGGQLISVSGSFENLCDTLAG